MLNQLLAHLVGDYILQSTDMATKKVTNSWWCLYHVVIYTLPFILITRNVTSLSIILVSHFFIDRFRLVRYVNKLKNYLLGSFDKKVFKTKSGFPDSQSEFLTVWLTIITDNTLHLVINYYALSLSI